MPVLVKKNLGHRHVVQHRSALHHSGARNRQIRARVVVGTLVENVCVFDVWGVELREFFVEFPREQEVAARRREVAQEVVELEERAVQARRRPERGGRVVERRRPDDPLRDRNRDRHPVGEVRVHLEHVRAFPKAAHHHVEGAEEVVHPLHRVHQRRGGEEPHHPADEVAGARPEQLRGLGTRAGGEILELDTGHIETASGRVQSEACASGAAANDKQVELLAAEPGEHLLSCRYPFLDHGFSCGGCFSDGFLVLQFAV
mmetsp:Transcript_69/g.129  ORF Transcript_69/g.129 Transcript_69/m.129 type:complete len:259 (-) Transcript_69:401-1177(-)